MMGSVPEISAAQQAMAIDVLHHILASADNPTQFGDYLAEQLRALTGARTAVLVQGLQSLGGSGHRVISVSPPRRAELAEGEVFHQLYASGHKAGQMVVWDPHASDDAGALLRRLNCGMAVFLPLMVGQQRVGGAVLLDVPDPQHITTATELLSTLSTIMGLIFRNAILFEQQEQMVQQRTEALRKSEQQMREALEAAERANKAKDQFLAAASHELRTPLTPALLLISSHESNSELPEEVRNDLRTAREHVELEKRLIGDLLDFAAIRSGKLTMRCTSADLHHILHDALRVCQEEIRRKGIRVELSLESVCPTLQGDPERLLQVCWNLLQNAVKFTPAGGRIVIQSRDGAAGIQIQFTDSGIGMDEPTLRRVFAPFEQGTRHHGRNFGGLGLGLAISRAIVEAHGGTIAATSPGVDQGSTFHLQLPTTPVVATTPPPAADMAAQAPQTRRLLLVEDHVPTLRVLARLLMSDGHVVSAATSKAEALSMAQQQPFDLVISDIGLPDGSGLELMPLLRDRFGLPGIALSGFGADADRDASRAAGFIEHITKPVRIEDLRQALARSEAWAQSAAS